MENTTGGYGTGRGNSHNCDPVREFTYSSMAREQRFAYPAEAGGRGRGSRNNCDLIETRGGGRGRCCRGRPRKERSIEGFPEANRFKPCGMGPMRDVVPIELTVEEYETFRLIDYEGLTQEGAGEKLGISRGSVQRAYASARKKVATMLVEGRPLAVIDEE